jgi:4-amino-4-deoxy-L-arabinose transferase-like glycosyltransferase
MATIKNITAGDFVALAGWFERSHVPIWLWIVVLWALFVFPAISLRAYHYEEGYIVSVARGVIENSDGLIPHWYGYRFVERPNLMAWIVALIGMAAGG